MLRNAWRYWRLVLWLMAMGAAVYGIESSPLPGPAQTALTTVVSIFGGLQMMIDLIDNRDILRRAETAELEKAALERERAAAERRAEAIEREMAVIEREKAVIEREKAATERENAELRRRIAELEQSDTQQ